MSAKPSLPSGARLRREPPPTAAIIGLAVLFLVVDLLGWLMLNGGTCQDSGSAAAGSSRVDLCDYVHNHRLIGWVIVLGPSLVLLSLGVASRLTSRWWLFVCALIGSLLAATVVWMLPGLYPAR